MKTARYALLLVLGMVIIWAGAVFPGHSVLKPLQDNTVVFIGDSITNHWDLPDMIGTYRVIKCGVDGETTSNMVARFESDVLKIRPDKVFILGGINDIQLAYSNDPHSLDAALQQTTGNVRTMAQWSKQKGIEPVLCAVLPVGANYSAVPPAEINTAVQKLNVSLKDLAQTEDVPYLDLEQTLSYDGRHLLKEEYARPDGLHISPPGYQQLTLAVSEFLH